MVFKLPSAATLEALILLLNWSLVKSTELSGLRRTTCPSVPAPRNGLAASGVNVPSGATDHPSVMVLEAKLASPPYKRSPAQLKSKPETNPVPVRGKGEPAAGVSEPSALMAYVETLDSLLTARS